MSAALNGRARAVAVGLLADLLVGDPPPPWHPVGWFGTAMAGAERVLYRDARSAGVAHAGIGALVGWAAARACPSTAVATGICVAGRGLTRAAHEVADRLADDDLDGARELLPGLAGRDPANLDRAEITRAVVESVAENTVDAIVAPACWAVLAGAPGVFVHRAVNTMDAMVGHRNRRYQRYGWAAARLDDAAAWLPARLTACLVATVRPHATARIGRVVRDQASAHPSPNAGVAEAAYAAALDIQLGGTNRYGEAIEHRPRLGNGPPPTPVDIRRATRLCRDVTLAAIALLATMPARTGAAP